MAKVPSRGPVVGRLAQKNASLTDDRTFMLSAANGGTEPIPLKNYVLRVQKIEL